MATTRLLLVLALYSAGIHVIFSITDPNDDLVLRLLQGSWENTPASWENYTDPCGLPWEGVGCTDTRVTELKLSSMGLIGELNRYIGQLPELTSLDLSFNPGFTGSLPRYLKDLHKLTVLNLQGCSFIGAIPDELGNLELLTFLALNTNNFTGTIPPSLGKLSNLYFLDLSENQLTGPLTVSNSTSPGLDLLLKAQHFHLSKNQLSGFIPPSLFSSEMILIHVFFDKNNFSGSIPITLGLVQTLEMVQLDRNFLSGNVPSNLNNLTNVNELNLACNILTGPLPNLTGMNALNYVDLSNNLFDPSIAPPWFSTLPQLTNLVMEFGSLQGSVPETLFSLPELQQVKLKNNMYDTLSFGDNISSQLELVDLQNNHISLLEYKELNFKLMLKGNQVCNGSSATYCQ